MSLQSFKYNFGGGKIQLKYRLIEEKYKKPKRKLIEFSLVIILLVQLIIGAALMNTKLGILGVVGSTAIILFLEVRIYKIVNRATQTGTIFFFDDYLLIEKEEESSISYHNITSIYFKIYLVSPRAGSKKYSSNKDKMSAYAYLIQINTAQRSYTLKVENDLWLTEADKMQFHRYYPLMMYTLEELYNTYRIPMEEKPKNFEFTST